MENLVINRRFLYEEPEIAVATTVTNEADATYDGITVPFTGTSGNIVLYGATDVGVGVSALPAKNVKGSTTNEVFTITVTNNTGATIIANDLTISDDFGTAGNFAVIATPNKPRYRYKISGVYGSYTDAGWVSGDTVTLQVPDAIAAGDLVELEINTSVKP